MAALKNTSSSYYRGLNTELEAAYYLKKQNHEIIAHRYRSFFVEIDIVSFDKNLKEVCFSEVKSSDFAIQNTWIGHQYRLQNFINLIYEQNMNCRLQVMQRRQKSFLILPIDA